MAQYKIIGLFARQRGLRVLEALIEDGRFEIVLVGTHRYLPKSEDPAQSERSEWQAFDQLCQKHNIPLVEINTRKDAEELKTISDNMSFDFLLSVSWRFLVPPRVFKKAQIKALNMHRGKLPKYAGAEPIKQALQQKEETITLTVHEMVEELDAGPIVVEKEFTHQHITISDMDQKIEQIKREMLPLYPLAALEAIEKSVCKGEA